MPLRTISTQQAGQQLDATHFLKICDSPAKIYNIEGYSAGSGYLQLLVSAPSTGVTVPIWSEPVSATLGFSFVYPTPDCIDTAVATLDSTTKLPSPNVGGVWLAISSTNTVYTSVAIAVDARVDFAEYEQELPNKTFVGDTTTSVGSLQVWASASGPNNLLKLEAVNNNGTTQYLMLFAKDAVPTTGDYPIQTWTFTSGQSQNLNFGGVTSPDQVSSTGVLSKGCTFRVSSTAPTFTAVANGWTMRATYVPTYTA